MGTNKATTPPCLPEHVQDQVKDVAADLLKNNPEFKHVVEALAPKARLVGTVKDDDREPRIGR